MASPKTVARLEAQIQRRVAHCLQFEVADPRAGFVTVTRVELSKDLQNAKVFYSVLGEDEELRSTARMLDQACGFVQRQVAGILRTRTVPRLSWHFDESIREAARLDRLIREARERDRRIAEEGGERGESEEIPASEEPSEE